MVSRSRIWRHTMSLRMYNETTPFKNTLSKPLSRYETRVSTSKAIYSHLLLRSTVLPRLQNDAGRYHYDNAIETLGMGVHMTLVRGVNAHVPPEVKKILKI